MKIIRKVIIVFSIFDLLYPCSCEEPPSPEEAFEDADVVFSGLVTNIVLDDSGYYYEVTFQVIDVWKGEGLEEITVLTETYSDTCGYNFQINHEYLVYAYNYDWGIYTNICTRTNLLEYATEDLEYLNGLNFSTVIDIDGNIYQTVQIGEQEWMAENLKVTHYNEGSEIPTGYSDSEWDELDDTETGAYAVCNDDLSNPDTYGNIYNWYAVDDSRGVCPVGWHVPTDDEFKELEMFLGMSQEEADNLGNRGTNEGSKLAGNADLWNSGNLEQNSEFGTSGFTGLPGGDRGTYGNYTYMGIYGDFWSSTEYSSDIAWYRTLGCDYSEVIRYSTYKQYGFAVRCLKH